MTDIAIIGAGASGIMAAITAAKAGSKVLLLEKNDQIGRKILSTGNGRCNFTNADMDIRHLHSKYIDSASRIIDKYNAKSVVDFMDSIGIYPVQKNGYYYPYTNSAKDVRYALQMSIEDSGNISVEYDFDVSSATKQNGCFVIKASDGRSHKAKALIIATGGKAMPKSGSNGKGFELAANFGHKIYKPLPSLVALKCREKFFKRLKGIRLRGSVSLFKNNTFIAKDTGEIQLTDYGISGIPTFNISGYAAKALAEGSDVYVSLDFLPDLSHREIETMLSRRIYEGGYNRSLSEAFVGLFNPILVKAILERSHITDYSCASEIKPNEFDRLLSQCKDFRAVVVGSMGWDKAQTTCGGVDLSQISSDTMESALVDGLFFCGEVLDVDGECGGYNLQWAFSSGYAAGNGALLYVKN